MGNVKLDKYSLSTVMNDIENGRYNIPRFQRDFVWDAKKIIALMHSLNRNFPIGSLLISASDDSKLAEGKNEIIDSIASGNYKNNGHIVVDGQQRLTSLVIVYFAPMFAKNIRNKMISGKSARTIATTLKKLVFHNGVFLEMGDLVKVLEAEGRFLGTGAKAEANRYSIDIPEINDKVKKHLGNKEIFFQTISGWSDKEIIEIFTAMNSKTKPLTHIDLMNGAMFNSSNDNFALLTNIADTNKLWTNYGKISNELFVQLMKIYSDLKLSFPGKSVNYKNDKLVIWAMDIDKVNTLVGRWNDFVETIRTTMGILEQKLDIYTLSAMPKEVYLITTFALVCKVDKDSRTFDDHFNNNIAWITKRLIMGHYASGPNAKAMNDINNLLLTKISGDYIEGEWDPFNGEGNNWKERLKSSLKELNYKNKNKALFKLFISTLAAENPKYLLKDQNVSVRTSEVSKEDVNIHHFIPTNSKTSKEYALGTFLDSIGNLTLITAKENQNEIRNRELSEYLEESQRILKDDFKNTIESHLYNFDKILELMKMNNGESPIVLKEKIKEIFDERIDTIHSKIIKRYIKE